MLSWVVIFLWKFERDSTFSLGNLSFLLFANAIPHIDSKVPLILAVVTSLLFHIQHSESSLQLPLLGRGNVTPELLGLQSDGR